MVYDSILQLMGDKSDAPHGHLTSQPAGAQNSLACLERNFNRIRAPHTRWLSHSTAYVQDYTYSRNIGHSSRGRLLPIRTQGR